MKGNFPIPRNSCYDYNQVTSIWTMSEYILSISMQKVENNKQSKFLKNSKYVGHVEDYHI